jgi:manganese catalase
MYHHVKKLMYTVRVDEPDPCFGNMLLDLALIGAAQRVEHYEIAAYTTARNLELQLRQPVVVQFLTASLGEEQNAGQLLDQVAQPLMSVAKMPASVE